MGTLHRIATRVLLAAVVLTTFGTSCGVQQQRKREEFILESGKKAARLRFSGYTLTMTSKRKRLKGEQPARPIEPPAPITLQGQIAFRRHSANVIVPGTPDAIAIFGDTVMYVRRHKRGLGSTDPRNWARFDFADTDKREQQVVDVRGSLGFLWLSPDYFVGFVDGALTGSLRNRGTERVGDFPTTHWTANYDIDKAIREDTEERRKAALHMLRTMGHRSPSFEGGVWIDETGVARRFSATFEQRIDVDNVLLTTFTMELTGLGTQADVAPPPQNDSIRVRNQIRLASEFDIPGRS